jgi:hypothetical protein
MWRQLCLSPLIAFLIVHWSDVFRAVRACHAILRILSRSTVSAATTCYERYFHAQQ